jgi:hypothetical protein
MGRYNNSEMVIDLPRERIEEFCRRNHIRRMALFGSVLREDFTPNSDIDILVEFEAGHMPGFAFIGVQDELATIVGRPVDLNTTGSFHGPLRERILKSAEVIFDGA